MKPRSSVPGSIVAFLWSLNKSYFVWAPAFIILSYPSDFCRTLDENEESTFRYIQTNLAFYCCCKHTHTQKQTPWPLVRERTIPTERPPLVDEIYCQLLWIEECRVVSSADLLRSLMSVFYTGAATFLSSSSSFILTSAEWTPFQTHCYSENLVESGIEPESSGLAARNSGH
jgi:hypothetical protein